MMLKEENGAIYYLALHKTEDGSLAAVKKVSLSKKIIEFLRNGNEITKEYFIKHIITLIDSIDTPQ